MPETLPAIVAPSLGLTALEMFRTGIEYWALMMSVPALASKPCGDGHGVLVLPGFATDDGSTSLLRAYLGLLGYDVQPWRLGWNLDHRTTGHRGANVIRQIENLVEKTGQPASLVGWSLGGVIARDAARRAPALVRQVITIGSPFAGNPRATNVRLAYEWLSGNAVDSPSAMRRFAIGPQPLPMPSTAIFSKSDGITAWQNCIAIADHQSENIEVDSSHFGLVVSPVVFSVIADRLAQPAGAWAAFGGAAQKASS